jgi:hypothetical protein
MRYVSFWTPPVKFDGFFLKEVLSAIRTCGAAFLELSWSVSFGLRKQSC